MPLMDIASAAANTAGGVIGGLFNADAASQSGDAMKAAMNAQIAKLDAVGMPPDQSARIILNQYQQAGVLTPALEQQVHDQVSAFQQIKSDAQTRNLQVQALQQMSQYGKAGMTPDEMAQLRQTQSNIQQQNNANQQQIVQNMAMRGQGAGGAEIAARLGASQGAAQTASSSADQVSAMANQRALQAIAQQSGMAGQLRNQDFSQQATTASAQDQMNRFNVQNQMAVNQYNTALQNQANQYNTQTAQNISNTNTQQNNQELYNQLQRQRQSWYDKLNYANAYMNPNAQYGAAAAQQAAGIQNAKGQMWGSLFGGGAAAMSAIGNNNNNKGTGGQENTGQGPTVQNSDQGMTGNMNWANLMNSGN